MFELVVEAGFSPADFTWRTSARFEYTGAPLGYFVELRERGCLFSPGASDLLDSSHSEFLMVVRDWLRFVRREIAEPDFWEAYNGAVASLREGTAEVSDDSISSAERQRLLDELSAARKRIDELEIEGKLLQKELDAMRSVVDSLRRAVSDPSWVPTKKTIVDALLAHVLGLVMAKVISPESGVWLMQILGSVWSELAQLGSSVRGLLR